jgi:NADPH:quinone reductase-like Zn-dependent oxidoreductase
MTIMMAKAWGAKVITTARGTQKCAFARTLGADCVIDTLNDDFVSTVKDFGGADLILDILGGEVTAKNILSLKPKGRLVQVGVQLGAEVMVDLRRIMQKQAVVTGSMLRPRSDDEKARLVAAVGQAVWPMIADGRIKPLVDKVFAFEDVAAAHDYLERGQNLGKVVLRL